MYRITSDMMKKQKKARCPFGINAIIHIQLSLKLDMFMWRKTAPMKRKLFKQISNCPALVLLLMLMFYFFHGKMDQAVESKEGVIVSHRNEVKELTSIETDKVYKQANGMKTVCQDRRKEYKGNYDENSFLNHIYLNPRYKVLFCGVEKIALTFWRRVFRVLNDSSYNSPFEIHPFLAYQGEDSAHVMTLADIKTSKRQSYIEDFERFLFTRDPYERLFSAYIDKLYFPNGNYWQSLGGYIVKSYRNPFNPPYDVCGHNVTFKELVQFVIDNQKSLYYRDNHLIPLYEHCRPCDMNYTFVGKLENLKNDMSTILRKIGADHLLKVVQSNKSAVMYDLFVQDVYFLFYFRPDVSECMDFYQSIIRLWDVMKIRGLIDPHAQLPFNERTCENLTQEDLLQALLKASRNKSKHKSHNFRLNKMTEAYRTLTKGMLHELRIIFQPDCDLFGYNCTPAYIFS